MSTRSGRIGRQRTSRSERWRNKHPARYLWQAARYRARKQKLPFDITPEDIHIPDACPVLGIALYRNRGKSRTAGPNSPSLDRIQPDLGYVKGNILVVSYRANTIKNNATVIELMRVATFYGQLIETNATG